MSIWPTPGTIPGLRTAEGVLLSIRISVEPRLIEELLDALAALSFPINPEIRHTDADPRGRHAVTVVDFPAYEDRVSEVREALRRRGFDPGAVRVASMLEEIQGTPGHMRAV